MKDNAVEAMSTMNNRSTTLEGVALSREELLVILLLLKIRDLPGFDTGWAFAPGDDALSSDGKVQIAPALRALVARGLVQVSAGGDQQQLDVGVNAELLALIGVCARSRLTIRVLSHASGERAAFFLHEWEGLGTLRVMTADDIHAFMPVAGRAGIVNAILAILGVADDSVSQGHDQAEEFAVGKSALEVAIVAALQSNPILVMDTLSATSLEPSVRTRLTNALLTMEQFSEISIAMRMSDGSSLQHSAVCISAEAQVWCFALDETGEMLRCMVPNGMVGMHRWLVSTLDDGSHN